VGTEQLGSSLVHPGERLLGSHSSQVAERDGWYGTCTCSWAEPTDNQLLVSASILEMVKFVLCLVKRQRGLGHCHL
jgi:hypothetical protein